MSVHFTQLEFDKRRKKVLEKMYRENLDALLMF